MNIRPRSVAALIAALVLIAPAALWAQAATSTSSDLQSQIDQQNAQIAQMEEYISGSVPL